MNDELLDLYRNSWASERLALWFSAGRLDDAAVIPPLKSVKGRNGREVLQVFAVNGVSQPGQMLTLRIGKRHSLSLQFRFQDAVFFTQIGNDPILVAVDCGGKPGNQELEDHRLTSRLKIPTSSLGSEYAQPEIFQPGKVGRIFQPYDVLQAVRAWLKAHNRRVKREDSYRVVVCPLPSKSPWLNRIEPIWMHRKRAIAEPERKLQVHELKHRTCAYDDGELLDAIA